VTAPVGGATRVAGVIGDPVAHSRSPAIHNAAYAALGLDWVYVAFPVPAGQAAGALAGVRALGIAGLSVTMPHKAAAATACDELTPRAAPLGAINLVVNRDGHLLGDSTDGAGFLSSLADEGIEPSGASVLVVGAGGAARAMVLALGDAGARLTVANRHLDHAEEAAALSSGARAIDFTKLDDEVAGAHVVVNATPLGMHGEPPPFSVASLTDDCFVYDAVYHPLETPLLAEARVRGLRCANGLGMLVHQAAEAFELITGVVPSYDVMRAAALAAPAPDG
jgi:shikimate dehydrogenase